MPANLKIAYFVNQYPKVSHTFIRREIMALERLGLEVQRFALRGWAEVLQDGQDRQEQSKTRYVLQEGAAGLLLPMLLTLLSAPLRLARVVAAAARIAWYSDRRVLRHLACIGEACRLTPWLHQAGALRLHAHFGTNSAEVALYCRLLGGPPFSFTVHGPEEFEAPLGLAEKIREAQFVAAISSFCRSQIYLRCSAADWPKVQVVRCGIEPAFHEVGSPAPAPATPRLVCVGRLCEAKGQLLLIEAAAKLRGNYPGLEVVLAGDGPMRGEIEAAIRRHGLERTVRITGWIGSNEVRDEILAARALVLPTFAEGLPVVIMEAMALRRPVLTTFVAGIPELVLPGVTGWLFPAGSLDALVLAIEDCLARPAEEIRRLGEAGHERVLEFHSIDREAALLAAQFHAQPRA